MSPRKQTTAAKKARTAARAGEKYTAALRREEAPAAPATYSYAPTAEAGDDHVWARIVEDCPRCPCHAARVCADGLWGQASRPAHADGTPYAAPCPCEETAKIPEPRRLDIVFKGVIRTLDAEYHRHGPMRGRLRVLGYPFWAEPDDGSAPGRCGMVLTRSRVMRTARDDHGDTWQVTTGASVGGRPATITGWWTDGAPEG
ncbi:hypothetical protein ABZX93_35210 [Streptomyces sp. NPDC006632]|uniref:hypothetical protein n=1 Tax=Streptomyces sp. NPDC006632 TaxID=3157182 RepID=UPI0033B5A977